MENIIKIDNIHFIKQKRNP